MHELLVPFFPRQLNIIGHNESQLKLSV